MKQIACDAQLAVVEAGTKIHDQWGISSEVSVGCTLWPLAGKVIGGDTEIRSGTYVFSMSDMLIFGVIGYCAASILSIVTSQNGSKQVVADAGTISMTIDQRSSESFMDGLPVPLGKLVFLPFKRLTYL